MYSLAAKTVDDCTEKEKTEVHCCCKLFSKHYTEKLVMQISVTDLFIEGEQQSNKHNNAYEKQNL